MVQCPYPMPTRHRVRHHHHDQSTRHRIRHTGSTTTTPELDISSNLVNIESPSLNSSLPHLWVQEKHLRVMTSQCAFNRTEEERSPYIRLKNQVLMMVCTETSKRTKLPKLLLKRS
ncbi:unnamed protein product [Pleuronectes platessa]|uniref:Uncharacterized protein n=1 Tax=Pleuronectes platessa TaxID=8262 RepID=A0A9N7TNM2_PLEPL|nr:unnamed protein product [Pleuronectes platessa]